MIGHDARLTEVQKTSNSRWLQLVCECGKKFSPMILESFPLSTEAEIAARKMHCSHLEGVDIQLQFEKKRKQQRPAPFSEFKL